METILFYITLGFEHVTDFNGLDHFYFIMALALPYTYKQHTKLLWWVTLFTLGHTLSLVMSHYMGLTFSPYWIELLIPLTIFVSALPLAWQFSPKQVKGASVLTLLYGVIHGFGFGRYFGLIVDPEEAGLNLFSFALGVELAQISIVVGVVTINYFLSKKPDILKFWQLSMGILILLMAGIMFFERI